MRLTTMAMGDARPMPPSYQGPLDIDSSAAVAYSHRALKSSWSSDTITIRRGSDNVTQSFPATKNHAVDSAAVTTFLGGAAGFVTSLADQSGNAKNALQANRTTAPR